MHVYPDFRCPIETMGLVAIVFSVLSMWIALGQGKWFLRAAVGVAFVGMLVPPKAYQPMILLSASSMSSILILVIARFFAQSYKIRRRRPRSVPSLWQRPNFWLGLVAGTLVGLSVVGWAVRQFRAFGWLETLLLFVFVASAVLSIASLFGDRFRDGPRVVTKSDSERWSFHLRDAFLAFLVLAVLFSLTAFSHGKRPITGWLELSTIAAIMTSITVSVCGLVAATLYRWRALSLLILTSSVGSTFVFKSDVERWLMELSRFRPTRGAPWDKIVSAYVLA